MADDPLTHHRGAVRRWVPFVLYLAAVIAIVGSLGSFGWTRTWSSLTVPTMYPPFADARVIKAAVESLDRGYDPRVANVADPWRRNFNYPRLWIEIGKVLGIANELRFMVVSAAMLLFFVGVCSYLVVRFPSYWLLASFVSTSTLLGIERANTDLIIFCLLTSAALSLEKRWSPIPIVLGILLKLYPVFALYALVIRRHFRVFAVAAACAVGIFVYFRGELSGIRDTTPVGSDLAYGIPSLGASLERFDGPFWAPVIVATAIGIAVLSLAYYFERSAAVRRQGGPAFDLMLVGASIYVGTFALFANWDYRLIFLALCIPFLVSKPFPLCRSCTVAILVAMNETLITGMLRFPGGHMVIELAKIFVFVVLGGYLLALVLERVKRRPGRGRESLSSARP